MRSLCQLLQTWQFVPQWHRTFITCTLGSCCAWSLSWFVFDQGELQLDLYCFIIIPTTEVHSTVALLHLEHMCSTFFWLCFVAAGIRAFRVTSVIRHKASSLPVILPTPHFSTEDHPIQKASSSCWRDETSTEPWAWGRTRAQRGRSVAAGKEAKSVPGYTHSIYIKARSRNYSQEMPRRGCALQTHTPLRIAFALPTGDWFRLLCHCNRADWGQPFAQGSNCGAPRGSDIQASGLGCSYGDAAIFNLGAEPSLDFLAPLLDSAELPQEAHWSSFG